MSKSLSLPVSLSLYLCLSRCLRLCICRCLFLCLCLCLYLSVCVICPYLCLCLCLLSVSVFVYDYIYVSVYVFVYNFVSFFSSHNTAFGKRHITIPRMVFPLVNTNMVEILVSIHSPTVHQKAEFNE